MERPIETVDGHEGEPCDLDTIKAQLPCRILLSEHEPGDTADSDGSAPSSSLKKRKKTDSMAKNWLPLKSLQSSESHAHRLRPIQFEVEARQGKEGKNSEIRDEKNPRKLRYPYVQLRQLREVRQRQQARWQSLGDMIIGHRSAYPLSHVHEVTTESFLK